jgi:hypothetical protein
VDTNNIEIAALFAPKPLGLTAANDWTRNILTLGLPELKSIYRLFDAEDRVDAHYFPFEHNFNQVSREVMYGWLNTHLRLGQTTPIVEQPFEPLSPRELSVYDREHPRPADAADAVTLRRLLTSASDAQMRALVERPDEYRSTVETALRAMIVEPKAAMPSPAVVPVPGSFKSLPGDGFDAHLALLARAGGKESIPAVALLPKGWKSGPIVIWTHPDGKSSLFETDGRTPVPAVRDLLQRGAGVISADLFLTGEYHRNGQRTTLARVKDEQTYHTYRDAYNRTILAQRVHDLLTIVAFTRERQPSAIHLLAIDRAGVWGLLARALAGDTIARASIDLHGFDFDRVTSGDDEMLLPGALKYGGVHAFLALCTKGETEVYAAPPSRTSTPSTPSVTLRTDAATADAMARWVLPAASTSR